MGGVFISYRRSETASEATVLHRQLAQSLGPDQVFMDSRVIQPGNLLPETIRKHLAACNALVALIGKDWLHARDRHGRRRLDDPNDYVRLEIATALERNILVIPVLVQDAVIPAAEDLPLDLAPLVHRLALEVSAISDPHWDYDVERLINALGPAVSSPNGGGPLNEHLTMQRTAVVHPVPRELPRSIADFTGRSEELATLRNLLGAGPAASGTPGEAAQPVVTSAIDGMGGIGKSALAIQVAHELVGAGKFADGQLYVNLQGATPGAAPLDPLEALGRILRSLGLEPSRVPTETEEAAARFRSLVAGRRLLVLLDNAATAEQVRPLLPASPTCGVLVTSRHVLATLEGARHLHLDVLPHDQALELLRRIAGQERIAADPEASTDVVRHCGHLPLAIRIAGARLAARPGWPVKALAARLGDGAGRLEELEVGELAVRVSFDVSLETLEQSADPVDQAAAAAFGLLSLPDGPDLDVAAAARLLGQPESVAHRSLERLVDAQLLETPRPDRYQFHDLVRLYARQHAETRYPEAERRLVLTRILEFYTATAWHTLTQLPPDDHRAATAEPRCPGGGLRFADPSTALAWLEAERTNLLATIAQAHSAGHGISAELTCQLVRALYGFFHVRGYWHDGVQANQTVLELAGRSQDLAAQAHSLNDVGTFHVRLGRYAHAIACYQDSLIWWRELGNRQGEALSLNALGHVYHLLGRYGEAIACHRESLAMCRELRDRQGESNNLNNVGLVYERLGRYGEAIACYQDSLAIRRELGHRHGEADSLANLGIVHERLGRYGEAIACHRDSLSIRRALSDPRGVAYSVHNLGIVYQRLGRYGKAIACQEDSLTIFRELRDHQGEATSLKELGVVRFLQGRHDEAIACYQDGLTILRELGHCHGEAETLRDLGDALRAVGRDPQAEAAWLQASAIYEALQIPGADEIRDRLAAIRHATGACRTTGPRAGPLEGTIRRTDDTPAPDAPLDRRGAAADHRPAPAEPDLRLGVRARGDPAAEGHDGPERPPQPADASDVRGRARGEGRRAAALLPAYPAPRRGLPTVPERSW